MKRALLLLLSVAALVSALPLKKGNTWTWNLHDWSVNYQTWRTATLIDSTPVDSGTSWYLLVRDSVTGKKDTATLLAKRDGSQHWTRTSAWFPWDPNPPTASELALMAANTMDANDYPSSLPSYTLIQDSVVSWGGAYMTAGLDYFMAPTENYLTGGRRIPDASSRDEATVFASPFRSGLPAFIHYCQGEGCGWTEMPIQRWSDSLGLMRAEVSGFCEWTLHSFNAHPVAIPTTSLRLPSVGDSLAWSEFDTITQFGKLFMVHERIRIWKIIGLQAQAGDSVLVRIEERVLDSEPATAAKILGITLDLGMRYPYSIPLQAQGWIPSLFDFPEDSESTRIHMGRFDLYGTGYGGEGGVGGSQASNLRFTKRGELVDCKLRIGDWDLMQMPGRDSIYSLTIHRLDQNFLASVRGSRSKSAAPSNLRQLAVLHPDLSIRWTDARGHQGQIPASPLAQHPPASGVLFLEATLPDGTQWRGQSLDLRNDR
jgi:hypothetical protein